MGHCATSIASAQLISTQLSVCHRIPSFPSTACHTQTHIQTMDGWMAMASLSLSFCVLLRLALEGRQNKTQKERDHNRSRLSLLQSHSSPDPDCFPSPIFFCSSFLLFLFLSFTHPRLFFLSFLLSSCISLRQDCIALHHHPDQIRISPFIFPSCSPTFFQAHPSFFFFFINR